MRILRSLPLLIVLALAACDAGPASESSAIAEIAREDFLRSESGSRLILDVRTPEEYAAGHIQNALNIPHDQLAAELSRIREFTDEPVVLYCKSGRRAALAAEVLADAGFKQLSHLTGDMDGWLAAGYPVAKGGS